jgi:hypothetical protein
VLRRLVTCVALAAAALDAGARAQASRAPLLASVDHVPVAVQDLDAAGASYRRLGFVLKPGTPHANGIRNLHAKFPDGTEIELVTAAKGIDALTRSYVKHLEAGDGPAYLSLYAPDRGAAARAVPDDHPGRRYIFFGGLNHSPTDRPEHFRHPNTAESLVSVWLAAGDFASELDLLRRAGISTAARTVWTPEASRVPVAELGKTTIVMMPAARQIVSGRRIVGATVVVRDLDAAIQALRAGGVHGPAIVTAAGARRIFLSPALTHGWWLELRER